MSDSICLVYVTIRRTGVNWQRFGSSFLENASFFSENQKCIRRYDSIPLQILLSIYYTNMNLPQLLLIGYSEILPRMYNNIPKYSLREKSVFGLFLLCIFPHSDGIRRDTNAGKYRPEKFRIRTLFTQWLSDKLRPLLSKGFQEWTVRGFYERRAISDEYLPEYRNRKGEK